MEVLSGVASSIAVASLSLQLMDSITRFKVFVRDIKGAPKKLEKLVSLLDRIHALLGDVHNVLERQISLQGEHMPAPSLTIVHCLKSCRESLAPLQTVVEKYRTKQKHSDSVLTRVKNDIKFGLRTKEIEGFEMRIQQEVVILHAALGVNSAMMLMAGLTTKEKHVSDTVVRATYSQQRPDPPSTSDICITTQASQFVRSIVSTSSSTRKCWISSTLNMIGIRYRETLRSLFLNDPEDISKDSIDDTVIRGHELLITWSMLRLGLHFERQNSYTTIPSTISVYPIVDRMEDCWAFFEDVSIQDLQRKFASGAFHPFTRDVNGFSFFHIAAYFHRVDICRLLMQYGVKPDLSLNSTTPLYLGLANSRESSDDQQINICRFLLHQFDRVDGVEKRQSALVQYQLVSTLEDESLKWLWHNLSAVFENDDVVQVRCHILQALVCKIPRATTRTQEQAKINQVVELMDSEILQRYVKGDFSLLRPLFANDQDVSSIDSQRYGRNLLDLLEAWNVDMQTLQASESKVLGVEPWWYPDMRRKRNILFKDQGDDNRLLYWVWDLDPSAPGYTLVSEHMGLGPDSGWYRPIWSEDWLYGYEHRVCWPFSESEARFNRKGWYCEGTYWESRFNRREANKARKERARTGQKRSRRMPGAWSW